MNDPRPFSRQYGSTEQRVLEKLLYAPGGATVEDLVGEIRITTNACVNFCPRPRARPGCQQRHPVERRVPEMLYSL